MTNRIPCVLLLLCAAWGCSSNSNDGSLTHEPPVPTAAAAPSDAPVSEPYQVRFETSKGDFVVEVHPEWAPRGAARFRELVEAKFYDDCRFFRVIDGFMAQVGINGDPAVNAQWEDRRIPDDPVRTSNTRGKVTFATSGPDSRTTQIFINFGDNRGLDAQGFSPFGEVISGMEVVDSLYSGYGEGAPMGRGPDQGQIRVGGNEYLNSQFPRLDYIKTARIVESSQPEAQPDEGAATESQPGDGAANESQPEGAATEPQPEGGSAPEAQPGAESSEDGTAADAEAPQ